MIFSMVSPFIFDCLVLIIFLSMWSGYHFYSRRMAKRSNSLSYAMKAHRVSAVNHVMQWDAKITGAVILSNIDRNVSFFASTALFLLASLTGLIAKASQVQQLVNELPYVYAVELSQVYLRFLLLIGIFVYAYFTLIWSLRQSSFVAVMIGAGADSGESSAKAYAHLTAKLMDISAHSANHGLRAYYFSLAALTWFYHPIAFYLSTILILFVLFRREFSSKTTELLIQAKHYLPENLENAPVFATDSYRDEEQKMTSPKYIVT